MNRRDFLKISGISLLASLLRFLEEKNTKLIITTTRETYGVSILEDMVKEHYVATVGDLKKWYITGVKQ